MSKLVVLSLGKGDLYNGFPNVTVQLGKPEDPRLMEFRGSLPAAPEISRLYRDWQLLYSALYRRLGWSLRIEIEAGDVTNVSEVEFSELTLQLANRINAWLTSIQFHRIDQRLRTQLDPQEEIRFMIATNDNLLRRLPWHLWNFFEDYPNAEVALSPQEFQRPHTTVIKKNDTIKILAIIGNSQGIDIGKDKAFLEQLSSGAKIEFLVEPQRQELNNKLWEKGWDILFFAGHSYSQEKGVIQINQTEAITLDKLRNALKKAIKSGLKLAIFNSCDGLGLAGDLEDLHIPQVIVMREPVPDFVAQEFLRHFLAEFSSGKSLYAAVREARARLEGLEGEYPCATWFPVICQNPAVEPITPPLSHPPVSPIRKGIFTMLLVSLIVGASIMGVRHLGMLQQAELNAFDHLLQLRPVTERLDQRLLVVTIDEADIQYQIQKGMNIRWSLADSALAQLLQKLEQYKPRTIGIDLYRNFSVDSKDADLATRLRQDNRLFAVCKVSTFVDSAHDDGILPPPEVPKERLGFTDFVQDDDEIVRRQLLQLTVQKVPSPCVSGYAFGLVVALHYLDAQGVKSDVTPEGYLRINNVVFKELQPHSSGYQGVDASGHQILLNYRFPLRENIAQEVSLTDVLSDRIQPELIKSLQNRIILIGVTAPTAVDYWKTPYSTMMPNKEKQIPGVFMQAQMVSQIVSAVLDRRPLLWWWPWWIEALWVFLWSLVGGMALFYSKPLHHGLAVAIALTTLFGICFATITQAGWIPLVPAALALVVTQVAVVFLSNRRNLHSGHRLFN